MVFAENHKKKKMKEKSQPHNVVGIIGSWSAG